MRTIHTNRMKPRRVLTLTAAMAVSLVLAAQSVPAAEIETGVILSEDILEESVTDNTVELLNVSEEDPTVLTADTENEESIVLENLISEDQDEGFLQEDGIVDYTEESTETDSVTENTFILEAAEDNLASEKYPDRGEEMLNCLRILSFLGRWVSVYPKQNLTRKDWSMQRITRLILFTTIPVHCLPARTVVFRSHRAVP